MCKKLLFLGCFISLFTSLNAQTTLSPGDMAIVGLNYDSSPYEMAIVNLVPIASGTVIRITDYAYDESTGLFSTVSTGNTSEGSIEWTTSAAIPAGTVTKFTINSASGTPIITGLPGVVSAIGWTNITTTNCPSSAGGDNWFIFQGSSPSSVTTFVFAWCNPFALTHNGFPQVAGQFLVPGSGANNNGNSYLPPSLTLGTNAISLSRDPSSGGYHGDNNIYIGPKTGTKSSLITAISTISNWNTNETTTYDLNPGGANFVGLNPIFTISTPNNSPTDITLSATSINENVAANSTVGTLNSTDPDSGNTFTYSLVSGLGSTDNASFNISGNNLRITSSPDFEIQNAYSIRIRTTDQGSLFFEKQFTITINNLCDIVLTPTSQTNITCNGGTNGSATVSASGGTPGYTYSWAPSGGTAATATGLAAGVYTVTVTDANSCQATRTFTITQPTALNASTGGGKTDVSCNGGSNGTATVGPTGGTPGYTYSWSPSGGTAATATGLTAGSYTVTVTDANGCTATRNFTITQPTAISLASGSQTNVACNGGNNGSASVTPSGGNPAYTYSWSPSGGTAATATGLAAGVYTVTVTDANSCQATRTFTITQPTALNASTGGGKTDVSCNGGSNGTATVAPTGGTSGYTYSWSPTGGTAATASGLVAGSYTVTVTDANGCTATRNFTITQPTAISLASGSQTNIACNGGANGSASVTPSGGNPAYTYSWSPSGGTAATATGLAAGVYTVTVTDANGCTATRNFTITQPTAISLASGSQTNIACNGGANGSASVTPSGGNPAYTYSWSPSGGTAATATGLAAGVYTVTVTDANGCTATRNFTITQPTAISLSSGSQTNVACNGGTNGSATVAPTGGTPGYTYSWSPSGGTAATATGLAAGVYTVTVTDANSCQTTRTFTITEPSVLDVSTGGAQTNVSCNGGSNGTVTVAPTGGTPGYTYSWSPTGGTAATATGLVAGSYTVTVTDANGCTATRNFTITQPTAISLSSGSQTNVSCNGGSNGTVTVAPTGGTPGYTYSWSPTGGTAATATGLVAGSYTVTVTDANGCTATRNFTITEPTAIDNTVTLSSGVLEASQTGATYQWYMCPNTMLTGETNQTYTPTVVGDYKVEITLGGCNTMSSCTTVNTLSNNSFDTTDFSFYPNPTSSILNLSYANFIEEVQVINLLGQPVFSNKFRNKEIALDLSTLPAATYFIRITSEGKSKMIKIVKQ